MVIQQGDIFWIDFGDPRGSAPGNVRPCVIIQNNIFNRSLINTVIVCAITSNLSRGASPGNILLNRHEANMPKQSVVNISQIYTVDKTDLKEKIGSLSKERFRQILDGIQIIIEPREIEGKID